MRPSLRLMTGTRTRRGSLVLASTLLLAAAGAPAQSTPPAAPDAPVAPPTRPTGPVTPPRGPEVPQGAPADRKRVVQPGGGEWPANYFYDGAGLRFSTMIGKPPPALRVRDWIGEAVDPRAQIGKVVVIDFWGTWCGPCMQAIPDMVKLVTKHANDGLVVVGVHDGQRGWNTMAENATRLKINYPICIDQFEPGMVSGTSAASYRLGFWPTIVVVDRSGKVRAAGLQPARLEEVVEKLLAEPSPDGSTPAAPASAPAAASETAPPPEPPPAPAVPLNVDDITTYAEGDAARVKLLKELIGTTPTDITSPEWINTKPLTFESLKGKWVLLDFWASWCEPCKDSVPIFNALQAKYKDKLVILGVCQARGAEHMWLVAKDKKIEYPIVRMMSDAWFDSFKVDNLPDYYLIDPEGKLRMPDIKNELVEETLEKLVK